ncbi:hypothetical protein FPOAC2_03687 [Fusarium poae]|uniref:Uncharacterized protein n=1 Tax=Fusarium poae TaxID=36050 RepID=A0A1B8B9Q1_FUSPO|nr:hypothetical protein FPOA_03390 [Fusarium poae]
MEQFPQVIASLQQVSASAAALTAAVQSGTQSVPGQVRVQDGANTIKQAMKYAINTKSSIEEYEEYEGENAPKKRASQEATNTVTPALQALAEGIRRSQESFPDNVASELKSVLEEFETFQSSWEQLAQANGTSAGNYIPGILHMLSQSLDGAFEKLGGR